VSLEFFIDIILPGLGLTQPPVKMSTRNIPGAKGGRCVRLTTHHLHVPIILKSGSLNLLEISGPVQACNGIALPLLWIKYRTTKKLFAIYKENSPLAITENTEKLQTTRGDH
jgi:hypothetical protein